MSMKTVFNITNYKIKPEEILELLRKLKTSCGLGFPLQSATWLAGFPPKHSLTLYLLHIYTFLAYKYQSWLTFCNITHLYSQLVLIHLTQYNRKPHTKQICQIISFSSNLNAPTKKNQKTNTNQQTYMVYMAYLYRYLEK